MTVYKVSGETETGAESILQLDSGHLEVKQAVRIEPTVREGGPSVDLDIEDDDLLEVEFDDGFVLWTTIDRLNEDTERGGTRERGDDAFPTHYPVQRGAEERGAGKHIIRSVKILGYDLPKEGALLAAAKVERQLEGDGRFFRVSREGKLNPEDPLPQNADAPTLVLIHGTASSTANAYSGFFNDNPDIWAQIHDYYGGRVYGFEHRTLTKSPLQNAIEFLDAIPDGANLHLVAHSRGGLVGDLIAHGRVSGDVFASDDLERELGSAYQDEPELYEEQLQLYRGYNRRIAAKAPTVNRFVRVGCPAAGTTLASGRLDIYFSIFVNLISKIPGVGPILGGLGELAAAVAKERTEPEVLPGLEAQMPKSSFIRLLNGSDHVLDTDLTVLAGDSDGFIKNLANLFYWHANDLIVDTRSMYGGTPRERRLWHLEENSHVTHMNYFRRAETARIVERGLMRTDSDTSGFSAKRPKGVDRGQVDEGKPSENTNLPAVILLPGIMGSNLAVVRGLKANLVWFDLSDIMRGRGRYLAMDSGATVETSGVMDSPYEDFRDFLVRRNVHVMPMAYDWRLSLDEAVKLLAKLINARLAVSKKPLHIMAHSMGGLVASLLMERYPDVWASLKKTGGRLVQAGTPNLGSYVIPRILTGEEKIIRMLAGLDLDADLEQWAQRASRFHGILELAPSFDDLDFSKSQTWKNLGALALPTGSDLTSTQKIRDTLATQTTRLAEEGVLYVAGGPQDTPVYDANAEEIRFTERGDGRVTWESGIPPGASTWYVPVKHGSLLDSQRAFAGLRELLLDGHTDELAKEPPPASTLLRGAPVDVPRLAEEDQIEFIPSLEDLQVAALGMEEPYGHREPAGPSIRPCEISVVHGDLRFTENPVIVGHYKGDQIVHAEKALDSCLSGALQSRHQLGVYPGDIGTAEVVFKRDAERKRRHYQPTGAIVIGLGSVGDLKSGGLIQSVEAGLLRYAQACIDREMDTSSLKVSALVVGSGEAGLSIFQVLDAFLVGIANANNALNKLHSHDGADMEGENRPPTARFSRLEFIELYKDVALEVLHLLSAMPDRPEISIRRELISRDGGQSRPRVTSAPAWWLPVQIRSKKVGRHQGSDEVQNRTQILTFTVYGERARTPVTKHVVQKPLVDRLVAETMRDRNSANCKLPEALFELLVPRPLKAGAAERRNLNLVLDPGSAAYPWELLTDRTSGPKRPAGIGVGILRKLLVEDVDVVSHPEENRILVIGDPPSGKVELPGAQREAALVAELFAKRKDWEVFTQIRDASNGINASSIIQNLMSNDFSILHLAGHGIYDPSDPTRSGMVIGGSGEEGDPFVLITSGEVQAMRLQPELVFINCCHLGRIEEKQPFHKLAANLAEEFIRSGVKAVIAAGWPVNDEAAVIFCSTFYKAMLNSKDFGDAVTEARKQTTFHESNTWGAYQCYGDPGFRLLMDSRVRVRTGDGASAAGRYLDSSELIIELGNLASRAKVEKSEGDAEKIANACEEIRTVAKRKGWLSEPGILAGLARVHGELRDFSTAIDFYEQASGILNSGVTLRDLEQLANFRVRYGEKNRDANLIKAAIFDLGLLVSEYGETSERRSLIAGAYKRMVQLGEEAGDVRNNLRKMTEAYVQAANLKAENWYYPATNALLGVLLLGGPWTRAPRKDSKGYDTWNSIPWAKSATFDKTLEQVDAAVLRQEFKEFWDAVAAPDVAVVRALRKKDIDNEMHALIKQYGEVIRIFGSGREIDSVINQWSFAQEAAGELGEGSTARALEKLRAALGR